MAWRPSYLIGLILFMVVNYACDTLFLNEGVVRAEPQDHCPLGGSLDQTGCLIQKDPPEYDFLSAVGNKATYTGKVTRRTCDFNLTPHSVEIDSRDCHIVPAPGKQLVVQDARLYAPHIIDNCIHGGRYDSVHCIIMEKPWDVKFFVRADGKAYYTPHVADPCPYQPDHPFRAVWDSVNCHIELPPQIRDSAWKYQGRTLYYPGSPNCPEGGYWDSRNCKIMADPPTGSIWKLQGSTEWYYPPNTATKDCPYSPYPPFQAQYDSVNCWIPLPPQVMPYVCCNENLLLYDNVPRLNCVNGGSYDGSGCLISNTKKFYYVGSEIYYPSLKEFTCLYRPGPFNLESPNSIGENAYCVLLHPSPQAQAFLAGQNLYLKPAFAELVPYDSSLQPSFPEAGKPFQISFLILNTGNLASGPFKIEMILNNGAASTTISAPSFPAGGRDYAHWTFPRGLPAGRYQIDVYVDKENTVEEIDKTNNWNTNGFYVNLPP